MNVKKKKHEKSIVIFLLIEDKNFCFPDNVL